MYDVLCFGDSNTWGYDASTAERFARDVRWTGVLQSSLGQEYRVIEEGLNGRTTVWEDPVEGDKVGKRHLLPCLLSQAPLDLVIIMLGTNDLKMRYSAPVTDVAAGVSLLADIVLGSTTGKGGTAPALLIVAPPPFAQLSAFAAMFEGGSEKSRSLGRLYAEVARAHGCAFLDAGTVIRSSDIDGIHLEASEHGTLGRAVAREVKKLLP
jgi:lysophospholipase L1-like esterase